ncbi:uncharacterized protein LOC109536324 [Dendroctonus ponderosae]|uniref:Odorant-binding protein 28 n=1 Tax=Dendroctonus ponderosae TaxID=77166 RepID=M4VUX0_DENPD
MKYLVVLSLCLAVVSAAALTKEEIKERLKAAHDKCQADPQTAIDEAALKAFKDSKGKGQLPANMGPHDLCISKALKWQNADGKVNKELIKERITDNVADASKVDAIVNECAVDKENEIATAENLFKCLLKHHATAVHGH